MNSIGVVLLASLACACTPRLDPGWEGARAPHAAIDPSGVAHVAFVRGDRILVASESAVSSAFAEPVEVAVAPHVMTGFGRGPRLAATDKGLCLVAIDGETGTVRAWSSADRRTWSGPFDVTRVPKAAAEGLHALAGDGRQRVFACWVDLRTKQPELWGALSLDGGVTWGEESCVYRSPSGSICPCCAPSATYLRDSTLVVMFRNEIEGSRDPWLVPSSDGGKTFEEARKLGTGSWKIAACPSDGGAIVAADPGWLAIWRRDADVYLSTPVVPEHRLRPGFLPAMTPSGPGTSMAWQDTRNGKLTLELPGIAPRVVAQNVTSWTLCGSLAREALVVYESAGFVRYARP